jgi:hypothetical protein
MHSEAFDWEPVAAQVRHLVRLAYSGIGRRISQGSHPAVVSLIRLREITVSDEIGEAAFELSEDQSAMKISLGGLELIRAAGKKKANPFGGRSESEFCLTAMMLYLFHEANHISQNLIKFEDVQYLKRTSGLDRLGELDLIADCVAAQIFAGLKSSLVDGAQAVYNTKFAEALEFMIEFCFPAFGFPISKPHKVSRAMGIVLMLKRARLALGQVSRVDRIDAPLYPSFSNDFSEVSVYEFPEDRPYGVLRANYSMAPESTKLLLENIDCGDLSWIMERV